MNIKPTILICMTFILAISLISAAPSPFGEHKTVVILVNYNNANVQCTSSEVSKIVFGSAPSVNSYYQENSYGKTSITGDVVGPFTINYPKPASSSECMSNLWTYGNAIDAAATAAGVDLSKYDHKVYSMPSGNCGGGYGYYPGSSYPTRAFVFYCNHRGIYAHELGHNLNMNHAAYGSDQYGDKSDVMGGNVNDYSIAEINNAPHKYQTGFIPSNKFLTPTQSGVYTIASIETNPSQTSLPQGIIVQKKSGAKYFFSYRQAIGESVKLPSTYLSGINIHEFSGFNNQHIYTQGYPNFTYYVGTLSDSSPNNKFTDSEIGLTITQLNRTSSTVTFDLTMPQGCIRSAPTLTLTPDSANATAGTQVIYTVSIKNNDGSSCPSTTFNLGSTIPSGWSSSFSSSNILLGPGSTASSSFNLKSTSTSSGTQTFTVKSSSTSSTLHTQSVSGTYTILPPADTTAPTAPNNLRATELNKQVVLNWGAAIDNVGVSSYIIYKDNLEIASVSGSTLTFTDASVSENIEYRYYLKAKDSAGNIGASSSIVSIKLIPVVQNQTCTSSWSCGSWSTCIAGQQTRTCIDTNNCGVLTNKPLEVQSCAIATQETQLITREAESYDSIVSRSAKVWRLVSDDKYSGVSAMESYPDSGKVITRNINSTSPELGYKINFPETGIYYVWIYGVARTTSSDTLHAGLNGVVQSTSDNIIYLSGMRSINSTWSGGTSDSKQRTRITVSRSGENIVNFYMKEDGYILDKFLLTKNSTYVPK